MRYRLALDAGTASVGIVAYALDASNQPTDIAYSDLWIFSEPLMPAKKGGVGEPKRAAKRGARQARRQFDRKASRLRRIAHLLPPLGLSPSEVPPDLGQDIHRKRALAASEEISLHDLMRVLIKMAKTRGYSGTFRTKKERTKKKSEPESDTELTPPESADQPEKDDKLGSVETGIKSLKSEMEKGGFKTLGQYLLHRSETGQTLKLKNAGLYAHRDMVMDEFDKIWNEQENHHAALKGTHNGRSLREAFRDAIFHQRPLKSPAAMVGRCPLERHHPRAPMAQMAAQAFRIEKQIADLRWGQGRRAEPLSPAQKNVLRKMLDEKDEVGFEQVYKAFERDGCPKPVSRWLNFDRGNRDSIKGNRTLAAFRKLGLGDEWRVLHPLTQVRVINLLGEMGSPEILDAEDWHLRLAGQNGQPLKLDPEAITFVNKMVESGQCDRLSKMGFDGGRAAYSLKALDKLLVEMRTGKDEYEAIKLEYPDYDQPPKLLGELPPPELTGNTVVDVAMRQLWRRVNLAIETLGALPTQVIVELSRDLPLGIKKRNEIEQAIGRNTKARRDAAQELETENQKPTKRNIERYLLWKEQDQRWCPYCGEAISLGAALNGGETNIEHILPRSLTRKRGGRSQQVLVHHACNYEKGGRTPYQAWGDGKDPERWKFIEEHAKAFEKKKLKGKAKLLLLKDDVREVLDDDTIADWTARQFQESSWIAKRAVQWLRHICPDVAVSRGALTAHLRRIWGLDTVIPEVRCTEGRPVLDDDGNEITRNDFDKYRRWWEGHQRDPGVEPTDRRIEKRIDHRHHLVDALVIGLANRSLYQKMALNYKANTEKAATGERAKITLAVPPPIKDLRSRALDLIRQCRPKHRPDRYPDGLLFREMPHGLDLMSGKLVLKTKLSDLAGDNDKATRKALETIAAFTTRKAVIEEYERRRAAGKSPREALANPIPHPINKTPIQKVHTLRDSVETADRIEWLNRHNPNKPHYKYLVHNGNAYLEIPPINGKRPEPRLVRPRDAMREKGRHVPPGVLRIFKGDTVVDSKDGVHYVVKQIKSGGKGTLIMIPVTETTEVHEIEKGKKIKNAGKRFGKKTVSGMGLLRLSRVD